MMTRCLLAFLFIVATCSVDAQTADDSIKARTPFEVVVRAYEQDRRLLDVPVSMGVLGSGELDRFNNTGLLPALNTLPGVKMEERSPGSYRLNIRGSSLRSPFGVRNVKIYYNGIPFTDPGGNTYLNLLGFYNFQNVEVIKGPGSSLYGAGTGGVMLIESTSKQNSGIKIDYSAGSFGLQNAHVNVKTGNSESYQSVNFQHQVSDGFRDQSNMRRDILAWDATTKINNNQLSVHLLYGDLFYQTPGALTLAEYNSNPKASRPRAGAAPGSKEARAAIYLKSFVAGADYKQHINQYWQNTTAIYGAFTELKNPAIRNYGRNSEPHFGGRSVFQYKSMEKNGAQWRWHAGVEAQRAFNTVQVFRNKAGNPDSLLTSDDINNSQYFVFTQLSYQIKQWLFTGGISLNESKVALSRTSSVPSTSFTRNFNSQLAPRLAVLYKIANELSVYGSFSKGFSPPTVAELSPSGSAINSGLNAETGNNFEVGTRGSSLQNRLSWDVSAFYYRLNNAIVLRKDAFGGDNFINAGSTRQKGLETYITYRFDRITEKTLTSSNLWISYTLYNFRYKSFKQLTTDFSGNKLPGIAPQSFTAGLDIYSKKGVYLNVTYNYNSKVALNDANSEFAKTYNLLGFRTGYKTKIGNVFLLELFGGIDNLFNETYSLGNDINAFGGRYYNAALGRNYYAGISLQGLWGK